VTFGGVERRGAGAGWRLAKWLAVFVALVAIAAKFLGPRAFVSYDLYQARRAVDACDLADAMNWLRAAETRAPDHAEAHFILGVVCRRMAAFLPARRHLERSLALGYPRREVEQQDWMLRFQMGQVRDTEPLLQGMLDRGGSDELAEDVFEAMTLGYMNVHRTRDAYLCLQHWEEWRPDSLRARLVGAYLYDAMQDTDRLQAALREVLRIEPRRIAQRLRLAQTFLEAKRVDDALAECEICRKQAPGDRRVSVTLGACYFQLGRTDEAQRELKLALTASLPLEPMFQLEALTTLAQIASANNDFESAKRYCQGVLERRPYDATAVYGLGMALSRLGEQESAQEYFDRSQRLLEQESRRVDIQHELVRNPDSVELRLEMARILVDQERNAEAAAWMLSALEVDPTCREARQLLAEFYDQHGKPELAQAQRDAAAELEAIDASDGGEAASVTGDPRPISSGPPGS